MDVLETKHALRKHIAEFRKEGSTVGFVPTMGALHAGHLSLIQRSKSENDRTVVSVFVNPTQFGPNEDFMKYPRPVEKDSTLVEDGGADLLFLPTTGEIYPEGNSTFVEENHFSRPLCGPFRPGHFRGVATVVVKLLQITQPDVLYLGQKDAQQLRVVEKMVSDFDIPVRVVGCPTVREADGLAMSSRNTYLSPTEREQASLLYKALCEGNSAFENGERSAEKIRKVVRDILSKSGAFEIQYVDLLRWRDFSEVDLISEKSILATAAYLGKTRLIDNVFLAS